MDIGRRSEMKRRFVESNDLSALEKVDALEKSMEAFRKEMNLKLEFIQEILRAKNAQIEAQKRILDYESTVYTTLVENWDTNRELSKLGFSHLIQGLGDDIGRVLTNDIVYDENGNSEESDMTYEPSGDEWNGATSKTKKSRRSRKSKAKTNNNNNNKQQSKSPFATKKQRVMIEDPNSDPQLQGYIIKDENFETSIEEDDSAEIVPLEFVESIKGKPLLIAQGFTYFKKQEKHGSGTIYWSCTNKDKCKGSCKTNGGQWIALTENHTHPPDPAGIKKRQIIEKLKRFAVTTQEKPSKIIADVSVGLEGADAAVLLNPKYLRDTITRLRKTQRKAEAAPACPPNVSELEIPDDIINM